MSCLRSPKLNYKRAAHWECKELAKLRISPTDETMNSATPNLQDACYNVTSRREVARSNIFKPSYGRF